MAGQRVVQLTLSVDTSGRPIVKKPHGAYEQPSQHSRPSAKAPKGACSKLSAKGSTGAASCPIVKRVDSQPRVKACTVGESRSTVKAPTGAESKSSVKATSRAESWSSVKISTGTESQSSVKSGANSDKIVNSNTSGVHWVVDTPPKYDEVFVVNGYHHGHKLSKQKSSQIPSNIKTSQMAAPKPGEASSQFSHGLLYDLQKRAVSLPLLTDERNTDVGSASRKHSFTINLRPGQYHVNFQWPSRTQPLRMFLTPKNKSDARPPRHQEPLLYDNGYTKSGKQSTMSFSRRFAHRLLHHNYNASHGMEKLDSSDVNNENIINDAVKICPKGPGIKCESCHHRHKGHFRWGSLLCMRTKGNKDGVSEGSDCFAGYEGVEHLKRYSLDDSTCSSYCCTGGKVKKDYSYGDGEDNITNNSYNSHEASLMDYSCLNDGRFIANNGEGILHGEKLPLDKIKSADNFPSNFDSSKACNFHDYLRHDFFDTKTRLESEQFVKQVIDEYFKESSPCLESEKLRETTVKLFDNASDGELSYPEMFCQVSADPCSLPMQSSDCVQSDVFDCFEKYSLSSVSSDDCFGYEADVESDTNGHYVYEECESACQVENCDNENCSCHKRRHSGLHGCNSQQMPHFLQKHCDIKHTRRKRFHRSYATSKLLLKDNDSSSSGGEYLESRMPNRSKSYFEGTPLSRQCIVSSSSRTMSLSMASSELDFTHMEFINTGLNDVACNFNEIDERTVPSVSVRHSAKAERSAGGVVSSMGGDTAERTKKVLSEGLVVYATGLETDIVSCEGSDQNQTGCRSKCEFYDKVNYSDMRADNRISTSCEILKNTLVFDRNDSGQFCNDYVVRSELSDWYDSYWLDSYQSDDRGTEYQTLNTNSATATLNTNLYGVEVTKNKSNCEAGLDEHHEKLSCDESCELEVLDDECKICDIEVVDKECFINEINGFRTKYCSSLNLNLMMSINISEEQVIQSENSCINMLEKVVHTTYSSKLDFHEVCDLAKMNGYTPLPLINADHDVISLKRSSCSIVLVPFPYRSFLSEFKLMTLPMTSRKSIELVNTFLPYNMRGLCISKWIPAFDVYSRSNGIYNIHNSGKVCICSICKVDSNYLPNLLCENLVESENDQLIEVDQMDTNGNEHNYNTCRKQCLVCDSNDLSSHFLESDCYKGTSEKVVDIQLETLTDNTTNFLPDTDSNKYLPSSRSRFKRLLKKMKLSKEGSTINIEQQEHQCHGEMAHLIEKANNNNMNEPKENNDFLDSDCNGCLLHTDSTHALFYLANVTTIFAKGQTFPTSLDIEHFPEFGSRSIEKLSSFGQNAESVLLGLNHHIVGSGENLPSDGSCMKMKNLNSYKSFKGMSTASQLDTAFRSARFRRHSSPCKSKKEYCHNFNPIASISSSIDNCVSEIGLSENNCKPVTSFLVLGKPPLSPLPPLGVHGTHSSREMSIPMENLKLRMRSQCRLCQRSMSAGAGFSCEVDAPRGLHAMSRLRPRSYATGISPVSVSLSTNVDSLLQIANNLKTDWTVDGKLLMARHNNGIAEQKKNEGNALYKAKNYWDALKLYKDAIDLCPDCAAYYSNRSACYMMLGKYNEAHNDAREAVRIDPTTVKGYIRVAKCNIALGEGPAALSILRVAEELDSNDKSMKEEKENARSLVRYQEEMLKMSDRADYRTAIYHVDRALKLAIGCKGLKINKAEFLIHLQRFSEAQEIVNEILQLESGNIDAVFVRGLCLYYQDNHDAAFNHFQHVLRMAPDHPKARDVYRKAKQLKLKKDEGNEAFKKGNFQAAKDLYSEALTVDPLNKLTNAKLHFNRATVESKLNCVNEAVDDCTAAINLDENYIKAYMRRAKCYQTLEKHEEAVRDYEKVYKLDKSSENKQLLHSAKVELKKAKRKDYYKILGVHKSASDDEIKKCYRKMALVHHPDRHASASDTEKHEHEVKFKEIGEAYSILTDAKKRAMYDRGHDFNDPEGGFGHEDFDPNLIYQNIFGMNGGFPPGFGGHGGGFHAQGGGFPGASFPGGGFHFQFG